MVAIGSEKARKRESEKARKRESGKAGKRDSEKARKRESKKAGKRESENGVLDVGVCVLCCLMTPTMLMFSSEGSPPLGHPESVKA